MTLSDKEKISQVISHPGLHMCVLSLKRVYVCSYMKPIYFHVLLGVVGHLGFPYKFPSLKERDHG